MSEPKFPGRSPLALIHRFRWPLGALALIAFSAAVVAWARVRPGYDPYGWLVWGHLTIHGKLDTNGAPSWKPLPFLFTLPYALAGKDALYLWMTTAVAVSLSGVVFAWRVAFKLVAAKPERRYAAYAAGLTAAVAVLGIFDYVHSILSAESDTMIVALCLAATDCSLNRRYRWAFWLLWLAALGRPEAWVLLALYIVWAWRRRPELRPQMAIGVLLVPLLWFGIPAASSKSPFSAATLAENSPRALHGNKITGTIGRYLALNAASIKIAALLAAGIAVLRRDRAVVLVAAGVLVWVAVEVAFALHGWSAVQRYMYEAAAGTCVLAGVCVGHVIHDAEPLVRVLAARGFSLRILSPRVAGWAAVGLLAAFVISLAPAAHSRIAFEKRDLRGERERTHEIDLLSDLIERLSGSRILACGQPHIGIGWQSVLAWDLGTNVGVLYFSAGYERRHPHPIVNMYPHSYGWRFFPSDWTNTTQQARCRGLSYRT